MKMIASEMCGFGSKIYNTKTTEQINLSCDRSKIRGVNLRIADEVMGLSVICKLELVGTYLGVFRFRSTDDMLILSAICKLEHKNVSFVGGAGESAITNIITSLN